MTKLSAAEQKANDTAMVALLRSERMTSADELQLYAMAWERGRCFGIYEGADIACKVASGQIREVSEKIEDCLNGA